MARLVGEGDAKHGGGEATDASAVVVEEGFGEVEYVGGSTEPSDLICWLGMEGQISVEQKLYHTNHSIRDLNTSHTSATLT